MWRRRQTFIYFLTNTQNVLYWSKKTTYLSSSISARARGCLFTHKKRYDVTRSAPPPLCDNTVRWGDLHHTHAHAGAPTHLECTSTTRRSNRCRSFTLNYRRQRRSGGIAHSLRWASSLEEAWARNTRRHPQATCCLLLSTMWLLKPLTLKESIQLELQQMYNKSDRLIFTDLKVANRRKRFTNVILLGLNW